MIETTKYISGHKLSFALFVTNVIGAILYVFASMISWARPEEVAQGVYPGAGDAVTWAARTWPIFICFGLLNSIWLIRIKKWRDSYFFIATGMIWLIAMWIDFSHH